MEKAPPPPPRREYTPSPKPDASADPAANTWSAKMKARSGVWGKKAIDKGTIWSDKLGGRVNDIAEKKFGTEHFWPVTGDMPKEIEKCARILRAFTGESKTPLDFLGQAKYRHARWNLHGASWFH